MATVRRIGFGTIFELEDSKVGIGTDAATHTLQALGNIRSEAATDIGISSLSTYQGFTDKEARFTKGQIDNQSQSGSTSGEIVIDGDVTVSSGTTFTSGPQNLTVTDTFTLPSGDTNSRALKPTAGSLRFNQDFATLEFYTGNNWATVNTFTEMQNSPSNRGRAALMGGSMNPASAAISAISAFNIVVGGEETNFGDLTGTQNASSGLGNQIRGICAKGTGSTPDAIEYVTMGSLGNSITFGDLNTVAYRTGGASSSSTRGLIFGGRGAPGSPHNVIQYIEISTLGNALDFGDTKVTQRGQGCNIGSPIRGFCVANAPYAASIEVVTIASTGNSIDFGDNIYGGGYQAGCSNSVRGVIGGGYQFPGSFLSDQKSYITMASEGNAIEFGNLTENGNDGLGYAYSAATQVRGVIMGGMDSSPSPSPSRSTVDAFNFNSRGEVTVIGDLSVGKRDGACHSDSHGGLGGF